MFYFKNTLRYWKTMQTPCQFQRLRKASTEKVTEVSESSTEEVEEEIEVK